MGFFSKLFKGPEIDMEKSSANAKKMRALFNQAVEDGDNYRLIFGYTEDVSRFNYGFVHGSKTKNREFNCRLERSQPDNRGRSHGARSFRMRRSDLLPPVRDFESLSQ